MPTARIEGDTDHGSLPAPAPSQGHGVGVMTDTSGHIRHSWSSWERSHPRDGTSSSTSQGSCSPCSVPLGQQDSIRGREGAMAPQHCHATLHPGLNPPGMWEIHPRDPSQSPDREQAASGTRIPLLRGRAPSPGMSRAPHAQIPGFWVFPEFRVPALQGVPTEPRAPRARGWQVGRAPPCPCQRN